MANYTIIHNGDWLTIKDIGPWDEHKTVTNDAESVIKELAPQLNSRRLYYIDSEGNFARLLYSGNRFTGYSDK